MKKAWFIAFLLVLPSCANISEYPFDLKKNPQKHPHFLKPAQPVKK